VDGTGSVIGPSAFNRALTNLGTTTFQTVNLQLGPGMDIANEGQMTVGSAFSITSGAAQGQPVARILNNGTFTANDLSGRTTTIAVPFVDHGTLVDSAAGGVTFTQDLTLPTGGKIVLQLGGGAPLEVDGTLTIAQGGTLVGSGQVTTNELLNNGLVQVYGTDTSSGMLWIKARAGVANSGEYTQTGTGELDLRIVGGQVPECDVLNVAGQASLDGLLEVSAVNGYTVGPNDTFNVMFWGSLNPATADFACTVFPAGMRGAPSGLDRYELWVPGGGGQQGPPQP
jgi:hypothetical protein